MYASTLLMWLMDYFRPVIYQFPMEFDMEIADDDNNRHVSNGTVENI